MNAMCSLQCFSVLMFSNNAFFYNHNINNEIKYWHGNFNFHLNFSKFDKCYYYFLIETNVALRWQRGKTIV